MPDVGQFGVWFCRLAFLSCHSSISWFSLPFVAAALDFILSNLCLL